MQHWSATSRGKLPFVGWAPTKVAQRILVHALARELGSSGAHVAYLTIDMPLSRRRRGEKPDDLFAKPDDLVGEIHHVAHQPRSSCSFLLELRPFGEDR